MKGKLVKRVSRAKICGQNLKDTAVVKVRGFVIILLSMFLSMGRDLGRYLGDMGSKVYVSGDSFIKNMAKDDLNQSPLSPNEHELSQVPPSSHCVVPHLPSDLHLLRDPHVHVPDLDPNLKGVQRFPL